MNSNKEKPKHFLEDVFQRNIIRSIFFMVIASLYFINSILYSNKSLTIVLLKSTFLYFTLTVLLGFMDYLRHKSQFWEYMDNRDNQKRIYIYIVITVLPILLCFLYLTTF